MILQNFAKIVFSIAFCSLFLNGIYATTTTAVKIDFYGQEIDLTYDKSIAEVYGTQYGEESFITFLKNKEESAYRGLVDQLKAIKKEMNLNDWMYFELMHNSIQHMLHGGNKYEKTLFAYFLLSKSGYDSKITFMNHKIWVNVYTEDELYEISTILLENKNFVNLSSAVDKNDSAQNQVYLLEHRIPGPKRAFSFDMEALPNISPQPKEVSVGFDFKGQPIKLDITIDLNMIEILQNYPIFDEVSYLETPLSPTAIRSLKPQLDRYMQDMNEETQLEFLASITRMAFNYKEDHQAFGKNKPMIAEELFYYDYSDCEDRCALFYNLNKLTLDLPLLVIALPDHLSIAVAMKTSPTRAGNVITYQGRDYYFCDPTGPYNAHHIGTLPKEYRGSRYEILSAYK